MVEYCEVKSLNLKFHPSNTRNEAMICLATEKEVQLTIIEITPMQDGEENRTNQPRNQENLRELQRNHIIAITKKNKETIMKV